MQIRAWTRARARVCVSKEQIDEMLVVDRRNAKRRRPDPKMNDFEQAHRVQPSLAAKTAQGRAMRVLSLTKMRGIRTLVIR